MFGSDKQKKEKRREYNRKYRESKKGKESQKRATQKYQKTDKFKEYKRKYYIDCIKNKCL